MKTGSRPSATIRQASPGPIRFGSSSTDILLQPDATGPADRTKRPGGVVGSGSRRGRLVLSVGRLREYIKRETARSTGAPFRAREKFLAPLPPFLLYNAPTRSNVRCRKRARLRESSAAPLVH